MDVSQKGQNILTQVKQGMEIYDVNNRKVGKVESVAFGSMGTESTRNVIAEATGPATADKWTPPSEDTLVEEISKALSGDEKLPEVVRSRLLREGYVHVDRSGLFQSDVYILPGEISSISGDQIHLNVPEDGLIRH